MRLPSILFLLAQLQLISAAVRGNPRNQQGKSPRPPKPINWNLSYYSEPFSLCKPLRKYNPVEQARVHGVAISLFRKCGPKLIIPYATRYNFPAFAIVKAGDFVCFLSNLIMGYFDIYDQSTIVTQDDEKNIVELRQRFCHAMDRGNLSMVVTHRHEKYVIPSRFCHEYLHDVAQCAKVLDGSRFGDNAKYAVGHFKKLLL